MHRLYVAILKYCHDFEKSKICALTLLEGISVSEHAFTVAVWHHFSVELYMQSVSPEQECALIMNVHLETLKVHM